MPASLKNAIDYLHNEWHYKPVGFVAYGGVSAGTRSVDDQQVVTPLKMTAVTESVSTPVRDPVPRREGAIQANETMEGAARCSTSW